MPDQIQKKASAAKIGISTFVVMTATTFIIAASAHLQLTFSLGIAAPKIIPAAIVEGLCALFFINGAYRLLSKKTSTSKATFFSHAFAMAGILPGQISLAPGRGPRTESNDIYHSIMLALIIADAFYLMTEEGKSALKK